MGNINEAVATEDAEQVLIGAILIDAAGGNRDTINQIATILQPWNFQGCSKNDKPLYWSVNPRIYYAMLQTSDPPNIISVSLQLVKLNLFDLKYPAYMAECQYKCPCSLDWEYYAKAVKEYSLQRQARYYANKGDLKKVHQVTSENKPLGVVPL